MRFPRLTNGNIFRKHTEEKPASGLALVLILILGYFGYKQYVLDPKEKQASESMFRAEEYYRADSIRLALNGDAVNAGFTKIISRYKGTKAADLAAVLCRQLLSQTWGFQ